MQGIHNFWKVRILFYFFTHLFTCSFSLSPFTPYALVEFYENLTLRRQKGLFSYLYSQFNFPNYMNFL